MLQIRQIRKYNNAKYPRGTYLSHPTPDALRLLRTGAVSAVLLLALEACNGGGGVTSGIPAILPLSETDARAVLTPIFARNGVTLTEDVTVPVEIAAGDTVDLDVDDYNDSLRVGYEYIIGTDYSEFTSDVTQVLDSLINDGGPYIKTLESIFEGREDEADSLIQEFIDSLQAQGVI